MHLIKESLSLVLAGAWSEAILNPPWFARYCLGVPEGEKVNVTGSIINASNSASGGSSQARAWTIEGVTYAVLAEALLIKPQHFEEDSLNKVQNVSIKILNELKHTPISAIGYNVHFKPEEVRPEILSSLRQSQEDVIDAVPEGWESIRNRLYTTLRDSDGKVLNINKDFNDGSFILSFNFHTPVTTTESAKEALESKSFFNSVTDAVSIAREILGEDLNEQQ